MTHLNLKQIQQFPLNLHQKAYLTINGILEDMGQTFRYMGQSWHDMGHKNKYMGHNSA